MTPINRVEFLQMLEAAAPGLAPATVSQSDCYCFRNSYIYTFDGEVLCRAKSVLDKDVTGAVHGKPLLETLRQIETEEIEVGIDGDEFVVKSKREEARVFCDPNILSPFEEVEKPDTWGELPIDFPQAIQMVAECAGSDNKKFLITCVHITPKFVEAFDNFSFSRYRLKIPIDKPTIIRAKAAGQIGHRGPSKMAVTENWLHFRNSMIRMSVQRFDPADHKGELLKRLDGLLEEKGKRVPFPESTIDGSKITEIFSKENKDNNKITVKLKDRKIRLYGEGASGRSKHWSKIKYDGKPISFIVGPSVLQGIIQKNNEIEVVPPTDELDGRLIVNSDRWFFCTTTKRVS